MKRSGFLVVTLLTAYLTLTGCGRRGAGKTDASPTPPTGTLPKLADADVEQILKRGGKNWQAAAFASGLFGNKFEPGDRLWIWPAEDKGWTTTAGNISVPVNWQLRSGKTLPDSTVEAYLTFSSATKDHFARAHVKEFQKTAVNGRGIVSFYGPQENVTGDADVALYFSDYEGNPISNIVRIKIKFGG